MSRHKPRTGDGTAWLVADGAEPTGFNCYWFTGRAEDHMVEHAHLVGATAAVAWGRGRTPRVRIRTADTRSWWAGSAPRPAGIALTWIDP
jgi:hypothetical protein